jgi:antimicrobial peptide system SdpA family protein
MKGLNLIVTNLICNLVITILFILLVSCYLPYNTIKPNWLYSPYLTCFFPQGWSFFTKSAKNNHLKLYAIQENYKPKFVNVQTGGSMENMYGIMRKNRMLSLQISNIPELGDSSIYIKSKQFSLLKGDIPKEIKTINVIHDSINILVPGVYILAFSKEVPWAWRELESTYNYEIKIVKLNVNP